MKTAAVSKLKASLSAYLKRVKAGEEVTVLERGKPVARLVPVRPVEGSDDLRELEKEGLVQVGSGRLPKRFWTRPRPSDRKGLVKKAILEEREESA